MGKRHLALCFLKLTFKGKNNPVAIALQLLAGINMEKNRSTFLLFSFELKRLLPCKEGLGIQFNKLCSFLRKTGLCLLNWESSLFLPGLFYLGQF